LLRVFPEIRKECLALPFAVHTHSTDGPVWFYPHLAEWMIRKFLNLNESNQKVRAARHERWVHYHERFSINCICYDYRHWLEIGGVQEKDEVGWGEWITENRKLVILAADAGCTTTPFQPAGVAGSLLTA